MRDVTRWRRQEQGNTKMTDTALIIAAIYIAVISLIAIFVTVIDKIKARHGEWRISEAALIIISALGGSVAMYLTMHIIRHKTKHMKFMVGIPIILLFQVIAVVYAVTRLL